MSNGARHGAGVLAGVLLTPVIALCLMFGTGRSARGIITFDLTVSRTLPATAALLVAAVLLGLLMGSRLSPVASLIPGAFYGAVGLLWALAPRTALDFRMRWLPRDLENGYMTAAPYGLFLVVGFALLVASMAPSRWTARKAAQPQFAPRHAAPPPQAPMGPPPQQPRYGQDQYPPPYGQPAPEQRPQPPAPEPEKRRDRPGDDDDNPGEWTQMYGGNR